MNTLLSGEFARILLRYGIGALVAYGYMKLELGNQIIDDENLINLLSIVIGAVTSFVVERWWLKVRPSPEAKQAAKAVDAGQKVTVEGPRGGKEVIQKEAK